MSDDTARQNLPKDARLAAKCLSDMDTFQIGQDILRECADRIEALEAQLAEAEARAIRLADAVRDVAAKACERAAYDGKSPINDHIELGCLRSRDYVRAIDPRALLEQMKEPE